MAKPEPPKQEPPKEEPPAPAPSFATKDDLAAINAAMQNITSQLAQFGGRVDVLANERGRASEPTPPQPKPFQRTVTQDMIDAAHDEGDYKKASRLQSTFTAETIQEANLAIQNQITQLQHNGLSMIANVVGTQARGGLKYYDRFKKEIEECLAQVDPSVRANPEAYKWAHDTVVGKHHDELLREAEEAAVRKFMDGGADPMPNGSPSRKSSDELTLETAYGPEADSIKSFLRRMGRTIEQHAKMNKYTNVQDYLKFVKAKREKMETANG